MLVKRPVRHVRGDLLEIWDFCFQRRTCIVDALDIDAQGEMEGYADAMIRAGMASDTPEGVRVSGVSDRMEWLAVQDAKRAKANEARKTALAGAKCIGADTSTPTSQNQHFAAGEAKREVADVCAGTVVPANSSGAHNVSPRGVPRSALGTSPHFAGEFPLSPSPSPSPSLSDPPRPARDPRVEEPVVPAADQSESESPRPPEQVREVEQTSGTDIVGARAVILAKIAPLHAEVFNRTATKLGSRTRPMRAKGDPAERALASMLSNMKNLDGVDGDCLHVLAVREAEALASGSVKYLGSSVWNPVSFARALAMSVEEGGVVADRGNQRAGPSGPCLPSGPLRTIPHHEGCDHLQDPRDL